MWITASTRHRAAIGAAVAMPLLLLPNGPAGAQNEHPTHAPATTGSAPASEPTPKAGQAPVGHRQPTPADLAAAGGIRKTERDIEREKRDRALDRKLQICRGC